MDASYKKDLRVQQLCHAAVNWLGLSENLFDYNVLRLATLEFGVSRRTAKEYLPVVKYRIGYEDCTQQEKDKEGNALTLQNFGEESIASQ
jgi:predicted solute-binding protein